MIVRHCVVYKKQIAELIFLMSMCFLLHKDKFFF